MDPVLEIGASCWNSRAWTYQESLCARRKLFFTDTQLLWKCHKSCFHESLNHLGRLPGFFMSRHMGDMMINASGPWAVGNYISSYSRRHLSHESDALNAILGIFRTIERAERPAYHVYGIPILPGYRDIQAGWTAVATQHSSRFVLGMCWIHSIPGARRASHPSWSWTGWKCVVDNEIPEWGSTLQTFKEEWAILAIPGNGRPAIDFDFSFEGFLSAFNNGSPGERPMLQIQGPIIDIWLEDPILRPTDNGNAFCRARLKKKPDGTSVILHLLHDALIDRLLQSDVKIVAMVVASESFLVGETREHVTLLVLEEVDKDIYERIGHCHFKDGFAKWQVIAPQHILQRTILMR
jgi:hypothetical protein